MLSVAVPNVGGMRVLHTSDWHVGRTFHGRDLLADQAAALRAIADVVADRRVDVVVVAGDLFDRAVPSADAVGVAGVALEQIRAAGAVLVVVPGNHDSAARLGHAAAFAAHGGLHLRTTVGGIGCPVVLPDEAGPVAFYGVPYLEPDVCREPLGATGRGHEAVLSAALDRVRANLATRPAGTRSVLLGHAFVVGGQPSGSERTITVGGVETVPAGVFAGLDYVALGHLHSVQQVADRVRYSGSPLPYSFGERSSRKAVLLVELGPGGEVGVERVELPVVRPLSQLSGDLPDLLSDRVHEGVSTHYLSVRLTDPVRPLDAMRRLQQRFPHAVHLEWTPPARVVVPFAARSGHGVGARPDLDVTVDFLDRCRGSAPTPRERALLADALAAAADPDAERTTRTAVAAAGAVADPFAETQPALLGLVG